MKAVFCCLNSKYIHSSLAPWCLYTSCKRSCYDEISFAVSEGTINEKADDIITRLFELSPDIISFSCYIWNIERVLVIAKRMKELLPDVRIVLGGPEVSFNAEEILSLHPFVDFVVSGAGEVTVPMLINVIYSGEEIDVPGVAYRENNTVKSDTRKIPTDESISPYCEEYFKGLKGRIAYIESSRGCPFSCAFCLSGREGGVRYIELERVKKEMLMLSSFGAKTVKFVDRTFNCNKKRAGELLSFIGDNYGKNIPYGTCFHFEIAADLLHEELFRIIESLPAGSVQFEVGIQSFNSKTLEAINRRTDLKKVTENVKRLISFKNCHVHIDLIAGLPGEDLESFKSGFDTAYYIGADMLQLGFLKVLKGSAIAADKNKYSVEYDSKPPYEVISTPWISHKELMLLHTVENELERLYNSGRFHRTLSYVLTNTSYKPFDLFYMLGEWLSERSVSGSVPLYKYINEVYDFFVTLDGIDKMQLRNVMITDRIATNNSGVIPERLKIEDPELKKIKNKINKVSPPLKGVNRSVAILYGEGKAIYCDYEKKHPVTGEYEFKYFDI